MVLRLLVDLLVTYEQLSGHELLTEKVLSQRKRAGQSFLDFCLRLTVSWKYAENTWRYTLYFGEIHPSDIWHAVLVVSDILGGNTVDMGLHRGHHHQVSELPTGTLPLRCCAIPIATPVF